MTSCNHILALDIGLSFCKALLFDESGQTVMSNSVPTPVINPGPGLSEISMTELWQVVAALIKSTVNAAPDKVTAIGVSGHGNGVYCIDAAGNPVGNAVTSMDLRAESELSSLLVSQNSVQRLWAGQPGMILYWLKRHEPERYSRIAGVMCCKDYLSFMLTGKCATDWSDISASGLLDNATGKYDLGLLEELKMPELIDKLPPVIRAFDIRGGVTEDAAMATGLATGTPVIGGMFDVDACIYGIGITEPGTLCSIAGTWNINAAVVDAPRFSQEIRQCVRRGDGKTFMLIDSSATSAVNIEWLLKKFFGGSVGYARFDSDLREYEWNAESPYWLPFVNGSLDTEAKKGALIGIDISHGSRDLIAAVGEGICFAHRFHIENLVEAGAKFDKVRLTGGAAKDSFCQLFSDICGFLVETVNEKQTGAAGICAAANVALGKYPDMASALCTSVTVEKVFKPDHDRHGLFNTRYERFKDLIKNVL
jgi:L-xylulokinase